MSKSNQAMEALVEAMRVEFGAPRDFDVELGVLIGRYRARHQRTVQEMQAAELLPYGAEVVAIRQHCHRATAYRRAKRAKVVAQIPTDATKS